MPLFIKRDVVYLHYENVREQVYHFEVALATEINSRLGVDEVAGKLPASYSVSQVFHLVCGTLTVSGSNGMPSD